MHTYRVWFKDGSAVVIDARDEETAKQIIERGIEDGSYYGVLASLEQLN